MSCLIPEYPHETNYPKTLPNCRAGWDSREGIPTTMMLDKLEETDMGYNEYENYLDKVDCDVYAYMRNAVTDRNLEQPFAESDLPNYNATKNSGALNIR